MKTIQKEVKYTETIEKDEGVLRVIKTPDEIVPNVAIHNIAEIQAQIDKIDGAISQWQDKRKPLQDIIDKYNEIK